MASYSDNFNAFTDGDALTTSSDWASNSGTGGVMTADEHNDTSDGTLVMDGSTAMDAQYAIYQSALASDDHQVTLDVFIDAKEDNSAGVLARLQSATDYTSPTCYRARAETYFDDTTSVVLYRVVSGTGTQIGSWSVGASSETRVLELTLTCDGSTIAVDVDGTERINVTDTGVTSGKYTGIFFWRNKTAGDGQPYVDNWTAADLAAGPATVTGTATGTISTSSTASATSFTPVTGTATGTISTSSTASATSFTPVTGTAAGTISTSGTASASSFTPVTGTATGTISTSGTASGTVTPSGTGTATGTISTSGTASASSFTPVTGTATGTISTSSTASATSFTPVTGTAAGTISTSGTASGSVTSGSTDVTGTGVGSISLTGTASGSAISFVTGTASGVITVSGAAIIPQPDPASLAALLTTRPPNDAGVPIGVDDWRFVVELGLPHDTSAVWGVAEWGTSTWGGIVWSDITDHVRGAEWLRGSDEPYGRPRIGELMVTLDARDGLSPLDTDSAYYAPGTLIRVSIVNPTRADPSWIPQFTGLIDSWPLTTFGRGADQLVEVRAYETLRFLSGIDDVALDSVVGFDDWPTERLSRLLEAAGWPYGDLVVDHSRLDDPAIITANFYALQSTDMALNRLGECYLVADTCVGEFRSGRDGRALLVNPWWIGNGRDADPDVWPLMDVSYGSRFTSKIPQIGFDSVGGESVTTGVNMIYVAYDADSIVISNEDAYVVNHTTFARVGGTAQSSTQTASVGRYGKRSFGRFDLPCRQDNNAFLVAWQYGARRANNTLRVDEVTVHVTDRGVRTFEACTFADIGVITYTYSQDGSSPSAPQHQGFIRSMLHRVTPRGPNRVTWTATYSLDTGQVFNLPAAQLPTDELVYP